jgi:hypothetical protein
MSLHSTLRDLEKNYDFVFLDAQAGADSIAGVAMSQRFSHQVVIVSEYDPLSAMGVERLKGLFREDLTYVRTWILLNKMLPDFVRSFSDFLEVAKYASPIPWDSDVVRAYARRRLALDLEKGNEFTLAVVQTLRSIFDDDIGAELHSWLNSRTAALREPIETQYRDAESELESLIRERSLARQRDSDRQRRQQLVATGAFVVLAPLFYILFKTLFFPNPERFDLVWGVILAAVAIFFTATATYFFRSFRRPDSVELELTEARVDRQLNAKKDQLNKLEALRSADAAVLLKHRGSDIVSGSG